MSISEAERHEIYESLKDQHGERIASNLMSMLPPVGWADIATKSDVAMLQTDLHALETRVDAKFERLEGSIDARFERVDARFERLEARLGVLAADLRTEMHQSVRTQTWALVVWTTGWTTALAGLVVALTR